MKSFRIGQALLAIALVSLTASAANADRWRCRQATERLNSAQAHFNQMQYMVLNNAQFCPGGWERNAACMMTIANGYNQAQVALQQAQADYNRACRWR